MRGNTIKLSTRPHIKPDYTAFTPPKQMVKVYTLPGVNFYSIRQACWILHKSEATMRRYIKANRVYHSRVNDLTLFADWQITAMQALEQKLDYVEESLVSHRFDKAIVYRGLFTMFENEERNDLVQDLLREYGDVNISMETTPLDMYIAIKNQGACPESPQKTTEIIVGNNAWCTFSIQAKHLVAHDKDGKSESKHDVSIDDFLRARERFLVEHDWQIRDLLSEL